MNLKRINYKKRIKTTMQCIIKLTDNFQIDEPIKIPFKSSWFIENEEICTQNIAFETILKSAL